MRKVFLDMDGVISDFSRAVQDFYEAVDSNPQEWGYRYREDFGMSASEFWEGLTVAFWENMPKTEDANLILALVHPYKPVILSAPPLSGEGIPGLEGKVRWIYKNLPQFYKEHRYLLGSGKQYIAHSNAILIDDKEKNIEEWEQNGGWGILWPQPWNKARHLIDVRIEHLQNMLEALQGEDY